MPYAKPLYVQVAVKRHGISKELSPLELSKESNVSMIQEALRTKGYLSCGENIFARYEKIVLCFWLSRHCISPR